MTILQFPDPTLRKVGEKVTIFDESLTALAEKMIETMHLNHGIGLAAPQVGKSLQMCVVDLKETIKFFQFKLDGKEISENSLFPLVIINPEIKEWDGEKIEGQEGCLSFPKNIYHVIKRSYSITCEFQDLKGEKHELDCNGWLARCILHEVDHLNGVLFIDKAEKGWSCTTDNV